MGSTDTRGQPIHGLLLWLLTHCLLALSQGTWHSLTEVAHA